jgi:hypothetical protein
MSSHDTLRVESHTTSAAPHALIIAQTSDLVLQACGLGGAAKPRSVQPDPVGRADSPRTWTPAAGGLDAVVEQLEARVHCRACTLRADWRRLLGLQAVGPGRPLSGSHAMAWSKGSSVLACFPCKNCGRVSMRNWPTSVPRLYPQRSPPLPLRSSVWMKPDSTLWAGSLLPLRGLSAHDSACTARKLVGLLDLRAEAVAATGMA